MLKTEELIKDVDEIYIPMLKLVNLPDFYKCLSCFSGLGITYIKDDVVKEYLETWARNKYRFFQMLGNKLRVDTDFKFIKTGEDYRNVFKDLAKKYPAYALWLMSFNTMKKNKVVDYYDIGTSARIMIEEIFPDLALYGSTITHFFKKYLNASDELVTDIASIFENNEVQANHTISIDPVDMMLASENPYNWSSCYRLELEREDSHADGCLAAILDSTSLITYVWNNEGKFKLYDQFSFKSIRYKRMRQWIAISPDFSTLHFSSIYPGKDDYDRDFEKQLRDIVETKVAKFKKVENTWRKAYDGDIERKYYYGYNEFHYENMYALKGEKTESFEVYTEKIKCLCGCGNMLPGSDDGEESYNGDGFIAENFNADVYCEILDEDCPNHVCECCESECCDCPHWQHAHPVCELNSNIECMNCLEENITNEGVALCNPDMCEDCPYWDGNEEDEDD